MLTVMKNRIIKADHAITNFLVNVGALPQWAEKEKEKAPRIMEIEQQLASKLQSLFTTAGVKFIKELKAKRGKNFVIQFSALRDMILSELAVMQDIQSEACLDGATEGRRVVIYFLKESGRKIEFSEFSPQIQERIIENFTEYAKETMGRIADDIADVIVQGYDEGLGIDDIADRLSKEFEDISNNRSKTIARTEITTAENQGKYDTMKEFNVQYKQWITARDERVRGSDPEDEFDHIELHGQVVRVDEPFIHPTQGWSIMYPGDRAAPIGAWINCRCTSRPYIPHKGEIITTTPYYP